MPLLFHRRDVTSDTAEGLRSGHGAETATDLLLDFHHPHIPLGQIVVKGHGKVLHKGQRFGLVLRQPVQQILAFVLFLAPTLTTGWRRVVVLFFQASLQESAVALLVVSELGGGQCRLRLGFGDIHSSFDLHQQRLHLPSTYIPVSSKWATSARARPCLTQVSVSASSAAHRTIAASSVPSETGCPNTSATI